MKYCSTLLLIMTFNFFSDAQSKKIIFTSDIDNFWAAYDSISAMDDFSKKIELINKLYIEKGTIGLKAFMGARQYNDTLWVNLMGKYPRFWNSIRPNTLMIKNKIPEAEVAIERLKKLYPELKEAEIYFTIGGLRSGGTVKNNMVLVGCEIATGNAETNVSEFENDWLKNVFQKQSLDHFIWLNIHEYVHTQQRGYGSLVLNRCIYEGACDFITELVMDQPLKTQYQTYGRENAEKIKEQFKKEMFTNDYSNWLYNGGSSGAQADLGYYVGYEICKGYYQQTKDKSRAIKDIIELNYSDDKAVEDFLIRSKFFSEEINKRKLMKDYLKSCPVITKIEPFKNNSSKVSASIKELRITFSKEMIPEAYSINFSKGGKDYFPVTGVKGFENEGKTLVLKIELKQGKDYEFIITNRAFRSKDGYRLKYEEYPVKFRTLSK